jgi:predicted AAA+ superfamily ATPase
MIKRYRYINKIEEILSLNKAVFLVGGRQVGKTTLMKYFFQEY